MIWSKRFSYKYLSKNYGYIKSRKVVENKIALEYSKQLEDIGLSIKSVKSIEWDNKTKNIKINILIGRCKHLYFDQYNKAACSMYKHRPEDCRKYMCGKVRKKIALDRYKKNKNMTISLFLENNVF